MGEIILKLFKLKQVDSYSFLMFMLIKNVEKPKLPKLVWALRKQFGPETLMEPPLNNIQTLIKNSKTVSEYINSN